jgi:hypothetical protein
MFATTQSLAGVKMSCEKDSDQVEQSLDNTSHNHHDMSAVSDHSEHKSSNESESSDSCCDVVCKCSSGHCSSAIAIPSHVKISFEYLISGLDISIKLINNSQIATSLYRPPIA